MVELPTHTFYLVTAVNYKMLKARGVHNILKVILSHHREYGLTGSCKTKYQVLCPCPQQIFGPQLHIEQAFTWTCVQPRKVGISNKLGAPKTIF